MADDSVREAARAAEAAGKPAEALAIVDRAISSSPNRADLHALRARIIVGSRGDPGVAASHALRAALLEPGNTNYRDMATEYAAKAGLPPPDLSAPVASEPPRESPAPVTRKNQGRSMLPRSGAQWGMLAGAAMVVIAVVSWNAWAWFLGPAWSGPHTLDAAAVSALVPLDRLQLLGATAYGVVTPAWGGIPDREGRVMKLADALKASGVQDVVLVDASNHIVARTSHGTVSVFGPVKRR